LPPKPVQPAKPVQLVTPPAQPTPQATVGNVNIGTNNVVFNDNRKMPMVFGKSANALPKEVTPKVTLANDHEGSSNKVTSKPPPDPKYSMPRWCPSGLTHSQKRTLQRLRAKEKRKKETEAIFNKTHPIFPPKQWKPKAAKAPAQAVIQSQP